MATIRQFEDIEAWQTARELTRAVYACSAAGAFARDFGLRDQMRRAAVSIMANIAEGFERGGSAEFSHFLSVAKGSAGEVEAHLYVALHQRYVTQAEFEQLRELAASAKRLIAGFMKYLKRSSVRGQKFKQASVTRD